MPRIPLAGPWYESRSVAADAQRTINWFPEQIESGTGKAPVVLYPTPGLRRWVTLDDKPVRGLYFELDRLFVVAGKTFYELTKTGTEVARGTIVGTKGPVTMRSNGLKGHQVFITAGGYGYIYDLLTHVFTPLTTVASFPSGSVISGSFLDGYFFAFTADNFQISGLHDGLSWNGLDKGQRSQGGDEIVMGFQNTREIWLWGDVTTEVWYDSGAANFPFAPIPGIFIEVGCTAPHSVARFNQNVTWLAQNRDGDRIVVSAAQYQPQRISSHAVETAWRKYPTAKDAVALVYQEDGHSFYQLTFPSAGATWVFDAATNVWHERAFWNQATGEYEAHRAICHARAWEQHLVGDRANGKIYEQTLAVADDDGVLVRRLRRLPHLSKDNTRTFYTGLEVDLETGIAAYAPTPPQLMLRWSDDRGHTWSAEQWTSAGATGAYMARARWPARLGSSRDRVFEVTVSHTMSWRLLDAYLDVQPGAH